MNSVTTVNGRKYFADLLARRKGRGGKDAGEGPKGEAWILKKQISRW